MMPQRVTDCSLRGKRAEITVSMRSPRQRLHWWARLKLRRWCHHKSSLICMLNSDISMLRVELSTSHHRKYKIQVFLTCKEKRNGTGEKIIPHVKFETFFYIKNDLSFYSFYLSCLYYFQRTPTNWDSFTVFTCCIRGPIIKMHPLF